MESTAYPSAAASSDSEKWYYLSGGKKTGPIEPSKLISMLASGALNPDTRVWKNGMDTWRPASETELMNLTNDQEQASTPVNAPSSEQPSPKRKSRWWIWLIVGILVAGILAAACFFLFFRKDAPEVPEETEAVEVITYGLENPVVYEDDLCAFLIDEIGEKGDYLELDVRCVNKTDDALSFSWNSICVNGNMFDPLWSVSVQGNATMKSSITFPLHTLESYSLLPAEQVKFILSVYNKDLLDRQLEESSKYIQLYSELPGNKGIPKNYKQIDGYHNYVFSKRVQVDKDGRPYYLVNWNTPVYFDEILDSYGRPVYVKDSLPINYDDFYSDDFGRPYYFTELGNTVYYDGYGFAFSDEENGKNYFYDEFGDPAYYGNYGIPEYYNGTVPQELLDAGMPESLKKAGGNFILHKEFTIYPTRKDVREVTYPDRIASDTEQIYWHGEKGSFVILGGTMGVTGYTVHTCIENNSDSYIYFSWRNVAVNGILASPNSITVLRPHSRAYRDILIPTDFLNENKIKEVTQIDFRVCAMGENLSVPLYPITWTAVDIAQAPN